MYAHVLDRQIYELRNLVHSCACAYYLGAMGYGQLGTFVSIRDSFRCVGMNWAELHSLAETIEFLGISMLRTWSS